MVIPQRDNVSKIRNKLENELISLKFWVLVAAFPLVWTHRISDVVWGGVVTALLGYREFSEARQNYFDSKNAG